MNAINHSAARQRHARPVRDRDLLLLAHRLTPAGARLAQETFLCGCFFDGDTPAGQRRLLRPRPRGGLPGA